MMVGIGRISFDCCLIVTVSDDDNGKLIEIYSEKFQISNWCISRTECQFETKKICSESCLCRLYFVLEVNFKPAIAL
jgi:hypothetical protein